VRSREQEPVADTPKHASINPEVTEPNQTISTSKKEYEEKAISLISKDIDFIDKRFINEVISNPMFLFIPMARLVTMVFSINPCF